MATLTIPQAAWDAFKTELFVDDGEHTDSQSLLSFRTRVAAALRTLESAATCSPTPSLPLSSAVHSIASTDEPHHAPGTGPTTTSSSSSSGSADTKHDVGTQLYTVRGYYLSTHIFAETNLRLSVRRLSRQVAMLCCRLVTAYETLWSLLAYHVAGRTDVAAPSAQWYTNLTSSENNRDNEDASVDVSFLPLAEQKANATTAILNEATVDALCATQHVWRHLTTTSGNTEDQDARPRLARLFVRRTLTHWATAAAAEEAAHPSQEQQQQQATVAGPFLCRRCRQDQRGDYAYDRENRRLAGVGAKARLPSRPVPQSTSRSAPRHTSATAGPRGTGQSPSGDAVFTDTMTLTRTGLATLSGSALSHQGNKPKLQSATGRHGLPPL